MNDTPARRAHEAPDESDWTPIDHIEYATGGPGAAFVSNLSLRLMLFLWLLGLIPGAVVAQAVSGEPGDLAPGELPVGGFIVVGYGFAWTVFWVYFIASRLRRRNNVTVIQLAPAGIHVIDHLGTWVAMRWEAIASIGWARLPSSGVGIARTVKPLTQPDKPASKIGASDGLIGRAMLTAPHNLPGRARKLLAAHPADADGLREVSVSFATAGRVDEANLLVITAKRYRPDLFTDRTVREPR